MIDNLTCLVRPDVALAQKPSADPIPASASGGANTSSAAQGEDTAADGTPGIMPTPAAAAPPRVFVGSVTLDGSRIGPRAGQIADEVLAHLVSLPGATAEVTMEITVKVPEGVPDDVARTVGENASTLKFSSAAFERD